MGLWDRLHKDDETISVAEALETAGVVTHRNEVWGRPGRCPECGGLGYLDRVDLIDRRQYEHCTECQHRWSVSQSETAQAPN